MPTPDTIARRSASFLPATWNDADNSVELCWTTGAGVMRMAMDGEFYNETLAVTPQSVRTDRLNSIGPVLLDHTATTKTLAGSVVEGTVRISDGKGYARVRFATTPDVADDVEKVKQGHLRTVSVGYMVYKFRRIPGDDGLDQLCAVDWEPTEISLTPVPADAGAIIRSRSNDMPDPIIEDEPREQPRPRGAMVSADRIRNLCAQGDYSRAFERELLEEHAERPHTTTTLQRRLDDEYARMNEMPLIDNSIRGYDGGAGGRGLAAMGQAIEDALYARMSGKAPSEDPARVAAARDFMGASMIDLGRGLLEAGGIRARWMPATKVLEQWARRDLSGAHSTSDFPNLLGGATRRFLLEIYNAAPAPLKAIARRRDVPDFKQITALAMLPFGTLSQVNEGGEIKDVTVSEGENGYALTTFANIFSITRQALINDDLGAFSNMVGLWARAATETESQQLAAQINGSGPTLADGKTLYHAGHNNLASSGSAISVASLTEARIAMRGQKNNDGSYAQVNPAYLVVGPAKETEAEQMIGIIVANIVPEINPFGGKLKLIVDPHLTGNSWRLFAEPTNWPVLEYAKLQGQDDVITDEQPGWRVLGMQYRAIDDFGCGIVDWRGTFKNPGN